MDKTMNGSVESLDCCVDEYYHQHHYQQQQHLTGLPRIHSTVFSSNHRDITTTRETTGKKVDLVYVRCGSPGDEEEDCNSVVKKKSRTWLCCHSDKNNDRVVPCQVDATGQNVSHGIEKGKKNLTKKILDNYLKNFTIILLKI